MKSHSAPVETDPAAVGAAIRELRRRAHLSQGELARRLGMRQGPVCNLEQGKNLPSATVLLRLANILGTTADRILRPSNYTHCETSAPEPAATARFSQPSLPVIRNVCNPSLYLASSSVRLEPEAPLTQLIESAVRDYLALEDICRVPRQARIPLQFACDPSAPGLERLAEQVRALLGVGQAVVFDHLELLENHGLRVLFMPLLDDVSGLSCYDAQNGNAFILVRAGLNPERQLFTLVYGLGRILLFNRALFLGEPPLAHEQSKDKAARLFAANFLMPAAAVRTSVGQIGVSPGEWDLDLLLRLKHRFGVSAETFNYRLLELGLISAERQAELRAAIRSHYDANAFAEPGRSRRLLSPNGRLGDLLHTALRRGDPEAPAIAARLKELKITVAP
jgi:Zn-dependent peptidase ImmA (M78 family)/transcriptional regulator with XRE-family HTH domain